MAKYLASRSTTPVEGKDASEGVDTPALFNAELAALYLDHAKAYYARDGVVSPWLASIRVALGVLDQLYGHEKASDFGPRKLKVLQRHLISTEPRPGAKLRSRKYCNQLVGILKRMFKWAASEELVPADIYQSLLAVDGLRRGHCGARETDSVSPVDDATVEATLPFVSPMLRDMVKLHRLIGCRPGELCSLRPGDVDRSDEIWVYIPERHKTDHLGHKREIYIGPQGQALLRPYLLRAEDAYCFSPAENEQHRREAQHAARKTPLSCGNTPGTNRKRFPQRQPGKKYAARTYARAIKRAINTANRHRREEAAEQGNEPKLIEEWSPNQLRHTHGTEVRRKFGLEAAQVALGHSRADVTQVYAERDREKAREVARMIG